MTIHTGQAALPQPQLPHHLQAAMVGLSIAQIVQEATIHAVELKSIKAILQKTTGVELMEAQAPENIAGNALHPQLLLPPAQPLHRHPAQLLVTEMPMEMGMGSMPAR